MTDLGAAAARLYAARRARDEVFGADRGGFGEPAWDMLLALVARGPMSAERLLLAASAETSVARRYLEWLRSRELVHDGAGGGLTVTSRAEQMLQTYLSGETT